MSCKWLGTLKATVRGDVCHHFKKSLQIAIDSCFLPQRRPHKHMHTVWLNIHWGHGTEHSSCIHGCCCCCCFSLSELRGIPWPRMSAAYICFFRTRLLTGTTSQEKYGRRDVLMCWFGLVFLFVFVCLFVHLLWEQRTCPSLQICLLCWVQSIITAVEDFLKIHYYWRFLSACVSYLIDNSSVVVSQCMYLTGMLKILTTLRA